MLQWVLVFLIVSIIAAVFGFTDIASTSKQIAKIIFCINTDWSLSTFRYLINCKQGLDADSLF